MVQFFMPHSVDKSRVEKEFTGFRRDIALLFYGTTLTFFSVR